MALGKDYSSSETARMQKHGRRLDRALKTVKSPERLAEFFKVFEKKSEHPERSQVTWALKHHVDEHAMNKLMSGDWRKYDDAKNTKKVREAVKRKLGLK